MIICFFSHYTELEFPLPWSVNLLNSHHRFFTALLPSEYICLGQTVSKKLLNIFLVVYIYIFIL